MGWRQLSPFDQDTRLVASKQSRQAMAMWRLHSGKANEISDLVILICRGKMAERMKKFIFLRLEEVLR